MKSDKLTYPEIVIIDGIEHNGKRNMSKGQILIPYTDAPKVCVGDIIEEGGRSALGSFDTKD